MPRVSRLISLFGMSLLILALTAFAASCGCVATQAHAQQKDESPPAPQTVAAARLDTVEITGRHYDNAVGTTDAASQGVIRAELLADLEAGLAAAGYEPSAELVDLHGSQAAGTPGSGNFIGVRDPAVDDPTLEEHHPSGTNAWSADAPIAPVMHHLRPLRT